MHKPRVMLQSFNTQSYICVCLESSWCSMLALLRLILPVGCTKFNSGSYIYNGISVGIGQVISNIHTIGTYCILLQIVCEVSQL